MIIKPMIRNNICLNSHPAGCEAVVLRQINYARKHLASEYAAPHSPRAGNCVAKFPTPQLTLVIGCSTGYGLASRIAVGFGYGAVTVGVSLERPASQTKPGSPGFYNNQVFDREARQAGLVSITLDGDAFSDELKAEAVRAIQKAAEQAGIAPKVDLVIYSLASPLRTCPKTGVSYRSVIKPIGQSYSGNTVDMLSGAVSEITAQGATDEEIAATIKVMGGEDWELWINALEKENVLSPNARTVAYTYIGPELSWPVYKNGTIGKAKEDLERAARNINKKIAAWVSVNKALVTRASVMIPVISLYVSCLYKVMKEKNIHESCIQQIVRLFRDRLYTNASQSDPAQTPTDSEGRIRIDDLEMREDVQEETQKRIKMINAENVFSLSDLSGFRQDFMEIHGFDVEGINYETDVDPLGF